MRGVIGNISQSQHTTMPMTMETNMPLTQFEALAHQVGNVEDTPHQVVPNIDILSQKLSNLINYQRRNQLPVCGTTTVRGQPIDQVMPKD
jgi:hypothetical protein